MDFPISLIDFLLTRQVRVLENLGQHAVNVVSVLLTAGFFAIVTGVVTQRNRLAESSNVRRHF
jgi:osmoprotectant transport system permease protein